MTRTELREHIFKLLFQVEFNETADTTEPLACYLSTLDGVSEKDADYIGKKFEAIVSHISEIDEIINQYAKGWKTNRMNKVDLSISVLQCMRSTGMKLFRQVWRSMKLYCSARNSAEKKDRLSSMVYLVNMCARQRRQKSLRRLRKNHRLIGSGYCSNQQSDQIWCEQ